VEELSRELESKVPIVRHSAVWKFKYLSQSPTMVNDSRVEALGTYLVKFYDRNSSRWAVEPLGRIAGDRVADFVAAALLAHDGWWASGAESVGTDHGAGREYYTHVVVFDEEMKPHLRKIGGSRLLVGVLARVVEDGGGRRRKEVSLALTRLDKSERMDKGRLDAAVRAFAEDLEARQVFVRTLARLVAEPERLAGVVDALSAAIYGESKLAGEKGTFSDDPETRHLVAGAAESLLQGNGRQQAAGRDMRQKLG
jgi:hypothetical protein